MTVLQRKTQIANKKLSDISNSISTRLFFESLPNENKNDYYKARAALKTFFDNLPQQKGSKDFLTL